MMAFVSAILSAIKRRRSWIIWAAIILLIAWGASLPNPPPETPEQTQARKTAQQAQAKLQAAEAERRKAAANQVKALCAQQAICTKFAEARQACATAGNYKNCVDIKMGSDATGGLYPCMNDGHIWNEPPDMPNRFQCLLSAIP
jgi:hypothetical protein